MTCARSPEAEVRAWLRRLSRHCAGLNRLLADARRHYPHANLYLACDGMHLMTGPSHGGEDGRGEEPHPERSLGSAYLNADGGDW